MGRESRYVSYKESISKESILAELDDYVLRMTWQESSHGIDTIRWYENTVCSDYDSAREFLDNHREYDYDSLAVRYKCIDKEKSSKKLDELKVKCNEVYKKYTEMNKKVVFKEFKSQYIGCKNCGSKLNKDYLNSNKCPLCYYDMRSETLLNQIKNLENKLNDLNLQIKEETKKLNEKYGKVYWLVKVEYHM